MSTTLTNGLKLPDKGSVDWYADMQNNYTILDGAVGTIAEHSTQIAGKANAVHTHTKADITDFPALATVATSGSYNDLSNIPASFTPSSHTHGNITNDGKVGTTANLPLITGTDGVVQAGSFGTSANTFCEGNDSRLSDARTPVAHTHLTADVTDLLNTAHEWTKEQICDEGFTSKSTTMERCVTPATIQHINFTFKDKNGKGLGAIRRYFRNSGEQQIQIFGNTRIKDGQYDETGSDEFFGFSEVIRPDGTKYFSFDGYLNNSIRPRLTNTYQLGDSSYQWASIYAQSYYYNGVAWGLDKANVWSQNQAIANNNPKIYLKNTNITKGVIPSINQNCTFTATDSAGEEFGRVLSRVTSSGSTYTWIAAHNLYKNGTLDTTGTDVWATATCYINSAGVPHVEMNCDLFPNDGITNASLGTSTNKWKSLNGVNPGALSLPDNSGYTNISGNITDLTGSINSYTPPFDGYVMVNVNPNSNNYAYVSLERVTVRSSSETTSGKNAMTTIPVIGGKSIDISVIGASIAQARFTPCLGNV